MADNTVDYSGLTTKAQMLLTDLMALSDKDGVLYKKELQSFVNFFSTTSGVDFKGSITAGTYATKEAGWYIADGVGDYIMGSTTLTVASQNLGIIIVPSAINDSNLVSIPISITIDNALDSNSTNAVENRVVTDALNLKCNSDEIFTGGTGVTYTNGQLIVDVTKDSSTVEEGAYSSTGVKTTVSSLQMKRMIDPVVISDLAGKTVEYDGWLFASLNTCIVVRDADENVLSFYNEDTLPSGETDPKTFEITLEANAYDMLLCFRYDTGSNQDMTLTYTGATFTVTTNKTYIIAKSISDGATTVTPSATGEVDISSLIPTVTTAMHKRVDLTNYALYPDNPLSIVDAEGTLDSSVVDDTKMFDVLTNTVVNSTLLGKGFTFNIPNTANTTAFTFTWSVANYMSFILHKTTIESGDRIGFSNSSGGFAWLNLDGLTTDSTVTSNGFTINVLEIEGNYIRLECYHATDNRKKLWFDFDSTSDVTLYDLIVTPNAYNKYATYQHIYEKTHSTLAGKRAMTWGDSNLSFGISYALKEQLGVNVSVNGAGGRRMGANGLNFAEITTSDYATQTGDGNWLFSWYRKKAIKYAIDTYGSIDLMSFYTCYNDGAGDNWINSAGTQYTWYNDIPSGTEGDFTNYSELTTTAIEAVQYNYPTLNDNDTEKDTKYARFLALTNTEKKQIFGYRQCFASLIKEILEYNPDCLIFVHTLLYLPASDDGSQTPSQSDATWRDRKIKFDLINGAIRDIADWFGVYLNDSNKEVGYYIGNAPEYTPDGTHFNANIGYRIGYNTAKKVLEQSLQLNYDSGTGSGPIVP